jgi:hypothetical protein
MRVDQFQTTLAIDQRPLGLWDAFEGGNRTASGNVYKAAGGRVVSLGSRATSEAITLSRLLEKETADWAELVRLHSTRVGKAMCTVTQRPLDGDGNPYGPTLVYRGRLTAVQVPNTDSNEDGEARWSVVVEPEG